MNIVNIIEKKKNNECLTSEEIEYAVNRFINDEIKDYQMSSLLMAICINGLSDEEVINLTDVMIKSGEIIDLSSINGIKVDKHSTGGVGDKTTLVLAPLVASCGVSVAKMSGRGLGHTGGTIDKLESIKGFNVTLNLSEFIKQVNDIGVSIVSQMGNLCLADKKIYALRDVTGTVDSIGLIASSIMSKKIASGADKFVIDVKVGSGAFLKTIEDAERLSNLMIKIGKHYNKEVICVLTDMNEVLGNAIGNGLEVIESINTLKGNGPEDLTNLVISLASIMVSIGKNISEGEAVKLVKENLKNGNAYRKFEELVLAQGGNINEIAISDSAFSIKSSKMGTITHIDTLKLAKIAHSIGAGRDKKEDNIDYGVGLLLNKKVGDIVLEGEELIKVYLGKTDVNPSEVLDCFTIEEKLVEEKNIIIKVIR